VSAAQVADLGRFERPPEGTVTTGLSTELRRDGVAIVTMDDARHPENALTPALLAQLTDAIARLEDDARVAAVVLASAKPTGFVSGVEDALLTSIRFAADAERWAAELGTQFARLEASRKPVVAALHGPALGAGFGLALACHAIVASDDPTTGVGLPEVHLGMVSPGNAALRVAVRGGLRVALEVSTTGAFLRAAAATELDLVDEVCPRAILADAAVRHAKALVGRVPRVRDERGGFDTVALERNAVGRGFLFRRARARAEAAALLDRRGHAAAALAVDVLRRLADKGFDEAARLEARIFGQLVVTATAHRLVEAAAARASVDRRADAVRATTRAARNAVVIGGGATGASLAFLAAEAGIGVRLKERDDEALGRALRAVQARVGARAATSGPELDTQAERAEREELFGRIAGTSDLSGVRTADLVIEAVPEDLATKQEVLRQVESKAGPRCVYASCTASIPVGKIALVASAPERVVGLHAIGPIDGASVLEVVRAEGSASWAVAAATALARRLGKTVIVVRDGPGFYTRRVLAPYLAEALHLLGDGVDGDRIDAALVAWGFVSGPLATLDENGIDVAARVAHGLHATFGSRMTPPGALGALVADDRRGRRAGRGLFGKPARDGTRSLDRDVYTLLGAEPRTKHPEDEIAQRCALAMVNEAARCLGEGVVRDAREGDIGAVLGLGFPRFRGGPFRHVDAIGAGDVLRRVQGYADRFGDRWRPAPLLVQMARKGERFYP
jgi:3-hydroxyacyl-CoA dehydrogenase/enoyl-CoA hydratase/3-hydroxybutyryl-CoA epimerase